MAQYKIKMKIFLSAPQMLDIYLTFGGVFFYAKVSLYILTKFIRSLLCPSIV